MKILFKFNYRYIALSYNNKIIAYISTIAIETDVIPWSH